MATKPGGGGGSDDDAGNVTTKMLLSHWMPLSQGGNKPNDANQKSFLDGSFAGGWQSNADLPDRRRIIFSILEVIRQMRPDTNKISQK